MVNRLERLYPYLPHFIQGILCNIHALRIRQRRYGATFFSALDAVSQRETFKGDDISRFLVTQIKPLLESAYVSSAYYRSLFDRVGFSPSNFTSLRQLSVFPIQTKEDVQRHANEMALAYSGHTFQTHTSGSTGAGLVFPFAIRAENEQWAYWWRYRNHLGIGLSTWCGYFGGRSHISRHRQKPPFFHKVHPTRQLMYSLYHLNDATVEDYVASLNKHQPPWLHGYPSFIAFLASLMKEKGLRLSYVPKWITFGAENVLEHQVALIEDVFGAPTFHHYGLTEPVANISMCNKGKLHVDDTFAYTEFVPVDGETELFHIVGTSWINPAFLFLRYDTNDIAYIKQGEQCDCGLHGRVVSRIDGRQEDYVTLFDGTKLGRLDHIFKDFIEVKMAQIHQSRDGQVQFKIVRNDSFSGQVETRLRREIETRLGDHPYRILFVDTISRTATGKLRFVTSEFEG